MTEDKHKWISDRSQDVGNIGQKTNTSGYLTEVKK